MVYEIYMDAMILFIERDIIMTINTYSIIYDFEDLKKMPSSPFINDCIIIY